MRVSSIKFRRCISMLFLALLLAIPILCSQRTNVYAMDEGQKAEISLDADMKAFKTFTVNGNTYRMAQMSGKLLKDTLGCSKVDVKAQYLCWVNIDKKINPSATIGWYTKRTYIHKKPVSNYNVTGVAAGNSNHIATMDTSSDKVADNINGKVTIDPYVSKVGIVCPVGETATMFYVNSDMIQTKVGETYTVRGTQHYLIYTSPMTDAVTYDGNRNRHVQNLDWLTLAAWASGAGYGQSGITWSSTASFASHYNVPIELESHDLRAQVMYRNELDIYDPDSDVGEKEQAKILRVDSKTGKDSSKLSKALKGDWIGRGGSAEIKEDNEIPVPRDGTNRRISPDNYAGKVQTYVVDAQSKSAKTASISAKSAKETTGNESEWMCVGFNMYYKDKDGHLVYFSHSTYGAEGLNDADKSNKVKVADSVTKPTMYDKRYLESGKISTALDGKEKTAEFYNSYLNEESTVYIPSSYDVIPEDISQVYITFLYLKTDRLSVEVNSYYTYEKIDEETKTGTKIESGTKDILEYDHENKKNSNKYKVKFDSVTYPNEDLDGVDQLKKGDTWYSYEVKTKNGDVVLDKNGKPTPILDSSGNYKSKIPYVRTYSPSKGVEYNKCYLWKVEITADDNDELYYEDYWSKFKNGSRTKSERGNTVVARTKSPFMSTYVKKDGALNANHSSDWQSDVKDMTEFELQMKHSYTINCYYTSTVPIQVLVYKNGKLQNKDSIKTEWASSGQTFDRNAITYGASGSIKAILGQSADTTKIYPYTSASGWSDACKSEEFRSQGNAIHLNEEGTSFKIPVGGSPIIIGIFVGNQTSNVGYTLVRYIHLQSGQYVKVEDEFYPLQSSAAEPHWHTVCGEDSCWDVPDHGSPAAYATKAYASFQQFDEYDDGKSGENGGIYELSKIVYNYDGPNNSRPLKTTTAPSGSTGSNNRWYYLHEYFGHLHDPDQEFPYPDYVEAPLHPRNTLVVYAIYEDVFSHINPGSSTDLTTTEEVFHWNWELPNGFLWNSQYLAKDDAEHTNNYYASVFGTNESGEFQAQTAIPSSDYIRATAQVPRYLTKGYWIQHNLKTLYKIIGAQVKQSRTLKTMVTGYGSEQTGCSENTTGDFYVYSYGSVEKKEATVERTATFYTLGDAEVWDPTVVTLENDTFADSACSKDNLITLKATDSSNAYFRVQPSDCGNYTPPPIGANWLYVNFGVQNSWAKNANDSEASFTDESLKRRAEELIGEYAVCNDQVEFFTGLQNEHVVLTTSKTGPQPSVSKPKDVPEADLTEPDVFDSYNHTKEGIQLIPTINNGHHDTYSIAYYKQVDCYNSKYKTDEWIKTNIDDDGDDDVEIFTPMVAENCEIHLENTTKQGDSSDAKPPYNFNQRAGQSYGENTSTLVLDMEYQLTVSPYGYCGDYPGYGTQNYARYLEKDKDGDPYMQVRFPFPVEMTFSTADGGYEERYYVANTWISLKVNLGERKSPEKDCRKDYIFFIPSWVNETEAANIKFRGITINARRNNPELTMLHEPNNDELVPDELKDGEGHEWHNGIENERDYVAQTHVVNGIVGRLYGLQVIDISDYPTWESVFRKFDEARGAYSPELSGNAYHSGTHNQNGLIGGWGTRWTTPTVDGSHPDMANAGVLGTGYKIRFKMESVGNHYTTLDSIHIQPTFYYMNAKGEYLMPDGTWSKSAVGRKEVNVYYSETIDGSARGLVKVGSEEDKLNKKQLNVASEDFGISEDVLRKTAESQGWDVSVLDKFTDQYSFSDVNLTEDMRVYVGNTHVSYKKAPKSAKANDNGFTFNADMYAKVASDPDLAKELTQDEILRSVQNWYGEYYLPSETYVTASSDATVRREIEGGFDGKEDCWLDGGYLVVNFQPVLETNGEERLRYNNSVPTTTPTGGTEYSGCDMFVIEGYQSTKRDTSGKTMNFRGGDIVLYAITNERSTDPNDPDEPDDPDTPINPNEPDDPDDRNDGTPDGGGTPSAGGSYGGRGTH